MLPSDLHLYRSAARRARYLARYEELARQWPVPSTARWVETRFGPTHVLESGAAGGPPLLMLPGIGSPGLMMGDLAAGLAGRLRTYAVDNIHDVGRSVETRPVRDADDFTTWLDELAQGLDLPEVNLLGLSYGGWIAARYALRFPERVGRVVLLAPAGTTAPIPWGFVWRAVLALLPHRVFMRRFMGWACTGLQGDPEDRRRLRRMADEAYLATRSFRMRRMVAPLPLSDEDWRRYRARTLFLAGDREVCFPPHAAVAKLRSLAPAIRAELLPGAGHDLFVTRADEVVRRVLAFLEEEPVRAPPARSLSP